MIEDSEQNLLTKIVLGNPTEEDFFAVSDSYSMICDFLDSRPTHGVLMGLFNIISGERYNTSNPSHQFYETYLHSAHSPDVTIVVLQNHEGDSYRVQ